MPVHIVFGIGAECVLQHGGDEFAHLEQFARARDVGMPPETGNQLGDAFGLVAHALQVDDHAARGKDKAQVRRGRLLGGDQHKAAFFDFVANGVHLAVERGDLARLGRVQRIEGSHRHAEFFGHVAAHREDAVTEFVE